MRLLATARDANTYDISQDGQMIATISLRVGSPARAELTDGRVFLLRRDDPFGMAFTIVPETRAAPPPAPLLRARRTSPLRRSYAVAVASREFTLRAESPWRGDYLLIEGGTAAGAIRQIARSRDATASLPDALPLEAAVALLWLVIALWRQGRARVDTI